MVASGFVGAGLAAARGRRRVRGQRFQDRRPGFVVAGAARPQSRAPQRRPVVAATILLAAAAPAAPRAPVTATPVLTAPAAGTSAVRDAQTATATVRGRVLHQTGASAGHVDRGHRAAAVAAVDYITTAVAAAATGAAAPDSRRPSGHTRIVAMGRLAPPPPSPPPDAATAGRVQAAEERLVEDKRQERVPRVRRQDRFPGQHGHHRGLYGCGTLSPRKSGNDCTALRFSTFDVDLPGCGYILRMGTEHARNVNAVA